MASHATREAGQLSAGASILATGNHYEVIDPSILQPVGSLSSSTAADVECAITKASRAQPKWASTTFQQRGDALARAAELIRDRCEEIATMLTREQGKPLREARIEVDRCADSFEFYSRYDPRLGDHENKSLEGKRAYVVRRPLGVCVGIVPWNFPLTLMANKVAPAVAAGNAIVVKPAPTTPFATARCLDLLHEAGVPEDIVRVVIGGADVGAALVQHALVRKVSFTGSVPTGRAIMELAAQGVKRLTLELGGNDPMIVCHDADVGLAARAAAIGRFFNAGQACVATKRLYVERSILDDFVGQVTERASKLEVGDGFATGVRVGPLHSEAQRASVEGFVHDATARGSKIAVGGGRPSSAGPGYFHEPTVLVDVPDEAAIVNDECFGPVMPIFAFERVGDAIERANASSFGLGSSIWSQDPERIEAAVRQLDAGYTWVNDVAIDHDEMPFGGVKQSGFGKERGTEVLNEYTALKSVVEEL